MSDDRNVKFEFSFYLLCGLLGGLLYGAASRIADALIKIAEALTK